MQEIIDTFGVDWRLLIIQAANFGLLLLVLWYFLYDPLLGLIEKRRSKIEEGVKNAERAEKKLKAIESEREGVITNATREAEVIVSLAKERGGTKEQEIIQNAQEKSERILNEAQKKAEESKRQAIAESQSEIARLAVLSAEKVLRSRSQT